jgi:hypothetical protein
MLRMLAPSTCALILLACTVLVVTTDFSFQNIFSSLQTQRNDPTSRLRRGTASSQITGLTADNAIAVGSDSGSWGLCGGSAAITAVGGRVRSNNALGKYNASMRCSWYICLPMTASGTGTLR